MSEIHELRTVHPHVEDWLIGPASWDTNRIIEGPYATAHTGERALAKARVLVASQNVPLTIVHMVAERVETVDPAQTEAVL